MRVVRRLAAAYAAVMGGVIAWAFIDHYTHVRNRQLHHR